MADNTTLPGTGDVIGADDVGGVKYQQVKLVDGTLDSSTPIGTNSNPLKATGPDCVSLLFTTLTVEGASASMDTSGYGAVVAQISGVWQGNCTFEASNDGTVWDTVLVFSRDNLSLQDIVTSGGLFTVRPSGRYLRINVQEITGSMVINALGRAAEGIAAADILSLAMDRQNNTPLQVQLNGTKQDAQSALILSDAAGPFSASAFSASSTFGVLTIDTTGYQSASITGSGGGGTIAAYGSNDGSLWVALPIVSMATTGTNSGALITGTSFLFTPSAPNIGVAPCHCRFMQFRMTAVTTAPCGISVYLRQQPAPTYALNTNIAYMGGATLVGEGNSLNSSPVPMGMKSRNSLISAFGQGTSLTATSTISGALVVEKHAVPELTWNYAAPASGLLNTTTAVTIKAAVASQRGNITSIQLQHEPLGAATEFAIRDGAAGTVLWRIKLPQTTAKEPITINFDPPLRQAAVNTLLEIVTLTASVTGAVYFNAQGFMSN